MERTTKPGTTTYDPRRSARFVKNTFHLRISGVKRTIFISFWAAAPLGTMTYGTTTYWYCYYFSLSFRPPSPASQLALPAGSRPPSWLQGPPSWLQGPPSWLSGPLNRLQSPPSWLQGTPSLLRDPSSRLQGPPSWLQSPPSWL